jgi:hypothetical protein
MEHEMRKEINKFKEFLNENSEEKLNISDVSDSEKIKGYLDMIIDGFHYHFISKKYDTKEELEQNLEWFSDWMKRFRNIM